MKARGITINETSATGSSAAKAEWWHKAGAAIYNNGGAYFMVWDENVTLLNAT
jgi:hypothetical protein